MPFDYDVVIVGSGPAGLTAGLHLTRAGRKAMVLERDLFGGNLQHADRIDDYSAFPDGISGADLAGKLIEEATSSGVTIEQAKLSGVELFSRSRWVACSDGRGFSCGVVILAGGTHYQKLGLPNEDKFRGRGVVDCTPCDGGFFVDRDVVVYGSTDYALRDALYLADLGSRVTVLAPEREAPSTSSWLARVESNAAIQLRRGVRLDAILGTDRLEGVSCSTLEGNGQERVDAYGLLVRIGMKPSTEMLEDVVDLDPEGYVVANEQLETSASFVLACGDIRTGSGRSVATAVEDGAKAAARAAELLKALEK